MNFLLADIFEYSFEHFPGFCSSKFIDILRKTHFIEEKIPVISNENIWEYGKNIILPQKGYIAGEIIKQENGIIEFSTTNPFHIETTENLDLFCVNDNQIINEIEYKLIQEIKNMVDRGVYSENCKIFKRINIILLDYKNKGGTQRKAFNLIMGLHKLFTEHEIEEKTDFIGDVLDIISGWFGNKEYWVWEEYLETQ